MSDQVFEPIRAEEFQNKIIGERSSAVIKVTTSWSGASRIISPVLEEFAGLYAGKINFFVLDYDNDKDIDQYCTVTTFPTLLFYRDGELVEMLAGIFSRDILSRTLESLIEHH
jgi:thioredoxin